MHSLPAGACRQETDMLNFEEELKKFHPSLEIEDATDAIYNQDFVDMADVMVKMVRDGQSGRGVNPMSMTKL